jgi:hypothetical protein
MGLGHSSQNQDKKANSKKTSTEAEQHGVKGLYVGGDWLPIEECADYFSKIEGSEKCNRNCCSCPRSQSRKTAIKNDDSYDVVIIGAGCIGETRSFFSRNFTLNQ